MEGRLNASARRQGGSEARCRAHGSLRAPHGVLLHSRAWAVAWGLGHSGKRGEGRRRAMRAYAPCNEGDTCWVPGPASTLSHTHIHTHLSTRTRARARAPATRRPLQDSDVQTRRRLQPARATARSAARPLPPAPPSAPADCAAPQRAHLLEAASRSRPAQPPRRPLPRRRRRRRRRRPPQPATRGARGYVPECPLLRVCCREPLEIASTRVLRSGHPCGGFLRYMCAALRVVQTACEAARPTSDRPVTHPIGGPYPRHNQGRNKAFSTQ
jgi:hypothetical protein